MHKAECDVCERCFTQKIMWCAIMASRTCMYPKVNSWMSTQRGRTEPRLMEETHVGILGYWSWVKMLCVGALRQSGLFAAADTVLIVSPRALEYKDASEESDTDSGPLTQVKLFVQTTQRLEEDGHWQTSLFISNSLPNTPQTPTPSLDTPHPPTPHPP